MTRWLDRFCVAAVLVLPVFLLHGRGVADTLLVLVDLAFLAASVARRDGAWLHTTWARVGLLWWGWLVLCSAPGIGVGGWLSFGHALAALRFLVFVAALQQQVLRSAEVRRWLGRVLGVSALYIGLSCWLQLATGRNIPGWSRGSDGELTGPFQHPRAGAPLVRLLFPTLLPTLHRLAGGGSVARAGAFIIAALAVGTLVLIGQRMPVLLTALGFVVAGLMLPRLRRVVLGALLAGGLLVGASAIVSPPTWHRLVKKFSSQMEHFPASEYGLIYARAGRLVLEHPVFGLGYAGFRNACPRPKLGFLDNWYCNIHPHNHYIEAATDAGLPGLVLFAGLMLAWLRALLQGLGAAPDPRRVGLFVATLLHVWPLASASSFYAIELTGFFLLLLGWGLAEASTSPTPPSGDRPTM